MRKEKINYVYIPDMGRPAYDKQVRTNTGSPTAQSAARDLLSYNNLLSVEFGTISIQISIQSHRFIMHKYCCVHVISYNKFMGLYGNLTFKVLFTINPLLRCPGGLFISSPFEGGAK